MKKVILALALTVTGLASYGQGYFVFGSNIHTVWDEVNSTTYAPNSGLDVAFLISSTIGASTGLPAAYSTTNGTTTVSSYASVWSDIANSSFFFATNQTTGAEVIQQTGTSGNFNYNSLANTPVEGTSAGASYSVYVIAWSDVYATPGAAAAAGAQIGWSNEFTYASGATTGGTVNNYSTQGMTPFGVAATPEPSTIALAGMGIASLLAFRRRK